MADGDTAFEGIVEVPIRITEYTVDGKTVYDYYDSDVWYETIEEAIRSFEDSVNGRLKK